LRVGSAHWLLLIPFYVFTALSLFLLLAIGARLLRRRLGANGIAIAAALLAVAAVTVPLVSGWAGITDYSGRRMLAAAGVSLFLALVDTLLAPRLPLPLDQELADV
jgi:hypothetical protein